MRCCMVARNTSGLPPGEGEIALAQPRQSSKQQNRIAQYMVFFPHCMSSAGMLHLTPRFSLGYIAHTAGCAPKGRLPCTKALPHAQPCCIISRKGKRFLQEDSCCWARPASRKGEQETRM